MLLSHMKTSSQEQETGKTRVKTESLRKLSNFNFQWTKTLYQNNFKHIASYPISKKKTVLMGAEENKLRKLQILQNNNNISFITK